MAKYHGKNSRVYVDGYDMSGYSNAFETMNDQDVVPTDVFGSSSKSYVTGLPDDSATHTGFFDDTADEGAHAVLAARLGSSVAVMFSVINGAGAPAYAGSAELVQSYNVQSGITQAVAFTSKYVALGTQGFDIGNMIMMRKQITGTPSAANGGSWDSGEASNSGARVYMQNFGSYQGATPGNARGTLVLQGGTDEAFTTPQTLVNFGSLGTAPSVQATAIAGTVYRYLRVVAQGGSPHAAVMLKRL